MTYTMNSNLYIKDTMKQIESIINKELKT